MKQLTWMLVTLLLGTTAVFAQKNNNVQARQSIAIGTELPAASVSLPGTDGNNYSLANQATMNGLIVMFSCNTCPYVIKAQERTREVIALAKEKNIGIVIVNSNLAQRDGADSPEAMKEYAATHYSDAPYVVDDGSLVHAFGATRTPEVFLFEGKGRKLVYKGAMEDNPSNPSASERKYLHEAVDNMLAGKPIDPESTKSIGCTIKL